MLVAGKGLKALEERYGVPVDEVGLALAPEELEEALCALEVEDSTQRERIGEPP